jgi:DNA-binding GntR family transcriptional regulator
VAASAAEVAEVYAMRRALELLALEAALPRLTDADLLRAEGALAELGAATDAAAWPHLNWEFHASLYRPAQMPTLLRTLESLHHGVARDLLIYQSDQRHQRASQDEHRQLLAACRANDLAAAQQVLINHLGSASAQSQAYIDSLRGGQPQATKEAP